MKGDDMKAVVFFGFALLWILWGIINYFYDNSVQIWLITVIVIAITWIVIILWNMQNAVMPAGSVRIINVKIP